MEVCRALSELVPSAAQQPATVSKSVPVTAVFVLVFFFFPLNQDLGVFFPHTWRRLCVSVELLHSCSLLSFVISFFSTNAFRAEAAVWKTRLLTQPDRLHLEKFP